MHKESETRISRISKLLLSIMKLELYSIISIYIKYTNRISSVFIRKLINSNLKLSLKKKVLSRLLKPILNIVRTQDIVIDFLYKYFEEDYFDNSLYLKVLNSLNKSFSNDRKPKILGMIRMSFLFQSIGAYRLSTVIESNIHERLYKLKKISLANLILLTKLAIIDDRHPLIPNQLITLLNNLSIEKLIKSDLKTKKNGNKKTNRTAHILGPLVDFEDFIFEPYEDYHITKPTENIIKSIYSKSKSSKLFFHYRDWYLLKGILSLELDFSEFNLVLERRNPILEIFPNLEKRETYRLISKKFKSLNFNRYSLNYIFLNGQPMHIQSIIANNINTYDHFKLYGINFYAGDKDYDDSYAANIAEEFKKLNNTTLKAGSAEHNFVMNYKFIQKLKLSGIVFNDNYTEKYINFSDLTYAEILEKKYN
jgi:hypothetical protein